MNEDGRRFGRVNRESGSFANRFRAWEFESHDFTVDVDRLKRPESYFIKGVNYTVPAGTIVGETHFTPLDTDENTPEIRSIAIWYLYKGLSDFMDKVDSIRPISPLFPPTYLYGTTNPEMASFAQRFGFEPIDEPFDGDEDSISVVGKTDIIRTRLNEISLVDVGGKKLTDLLQQRANRELIRFEEEQIKQGKFKSVRGAFLNSTLSTLMLWDSYRELVSGNELMTAFYGLFGVALGANAVDDARNVIKHIKLSKRRGQE